MRGYDLRWLRYGEALEIVCVSAFPNPAGIQEIH